MSTYIHESVFGIQNAKELYFFLKLVDSLKDKPLVLEIINKSNTEITVFLYSIKNIVHRKKYSW